MKNIVRIYYKSDFTVNMELPNGYNGQEFIIRLFVNDKTQYYEAKYIDGVYTNCVVDTENNVVNVYVDTNHNLPAGCLHVLSAFDYNNNHFHDGIETIAVVTETNIYLVKQNPNAVSAEFVASVLPDLTGSVDYVTWSDLGASSYASTTYVAEYVAAYAPQQDLSPYVTKTELNQAGYLTSVPSEYVTETELNNAAYATRSQLMFKQDALVSGQNIKTINNESILGSGNLEVVTDLTGYATEAYVNEKIAEIPSVDLSSYVTKTELNQAGYLTSVPDEYITQAELSANSYLTVHQDLSNYVTKTDLYNASYATHDEINNASYATQTYVADYVDTHSGPVDLSAYVTKTELNQAGYISSIPSEYVTEGEIATMGYITQAELSANSYLTEHQDLSAYVTKEELDQAGYIFMGPDQYITLPE